jgi:GT2 family glycosyltransferase
LRRLLEALALQQYPKECFEVVVVDDGGKEPLNGLEEEFAGRLRLTIVHQANAGCGPARQAGTDLAQGSYLAFTDDDCCPAPDWLASLARTAQKYPGCGVGGKTVNALENDPFAETTQFIVGSLMTPDADSAGCIRYCPTCNVAFPAESFRSAGGLDRNWSNGGGEDRDLCARWLSAGFALWYEPAALVRHFHALTLRRFFGLHMRYGRGAWRFHRSTGSGGFERPGFYWKLVRAPFRKYPPAKAVKVSGAVLLAQLATATGFLLEAIERRPE